MAKKDSLFDVILNELEKLATPKSVVLSSGVGVGDFALAYVRFIEQLLEKSELTPTELARARLVLQHTYIAVEPGYVVGEKLHLQHELKGFGAKVSAETRALLNKKPTMPKHASNLLFGDSPADQQLAKVALAIRTRRAKTNAAV